VREFAPPTGRLQNKTGKAQRCKPCRFISGFELQQRAQRVRRQFDDAATLSSGSNRGAALVKVEPPD
jgi:hypothetical protein